MYRSDAAAGTYTKLTGTPVTASAYDDTSAPVGTSYYRVTAVNAAGESAQSDPASATFAAPSAPATPTGLTATATASGISLDWADQSGVTGYNVYRSDAAAGTYTKLTGTPVTASAYDDTSAPVGTSYYRVTAVNAAGESAQSDPASATFAAPVRGTDRTDRNRHHQRSCARLGRPERSDRV